MIKFIGDFKELKKIGYTFSKLYANNYICYNDKKENGLCGDIWIWKKGREIEIMDLYGNSHILLQHIIDNGFENNKYGSYYFDKKLSTIDIRNEMSIIESLKKENENEREVYEDFYKRYHQVIVDDITVSRLKYLYENGYIEIE